MAALQELAILLIVARLAIGRGELLADDESVMVGLVLLLGRLVAVQARDIFLRVDTQFKLVNDRVVLVDVTFRAAPRRSSERDI
jgi:hypothetical protein